MKLENANNLKKGDKIIEIETTYNFDGTIAKEYQHELVVTKVNKKTVNVIDLTYNMSFGLIKNYNFGKINCGIKKEYYLA